ncbi:alkaline serine protease AorO [Cordyceps fumosorosea ARSEF 2679]|uniref:tripeptidyl-peptidase II n=1 Tax=Cordyceps fumosorosea (strain ARSEF 2679) TaxID=1081104 RepID=A0A167VX55_CORFA|nr:alkaline serine protease AorO [Cordyceps fumosorosea ARSEF 2679]OAA63076.1 alkaline serine protease AorO [Cordyceps fumosorosea ARSEF 2679]
MISSLILGFVLFTGALAAPAGEGGSGQPASAAVHGDLTVPVLIGMKQKNIESMMDYVMEVSDPASAKYGQHYSQAQVDALFAPDDQAIASVKDWLVKSGIAANSINLSRNKAWVKFESTVSTLESLLAVNLTAPKNAKRDVSSEVKLPQQISSVVEFVLPSLNASSHATTGRRTKNRGRPSTKPFRGYFDPNSLENCNEVVTPACIRTMYKIPKPSGATPVANNVLGIFETDDNYYNQADMDQFMFTVAQNISARVKPIEYFINGAKLDATRENAGDESNLDFQMTVPMIYPQQTALYQIEYPKYGMEDFNFIFAQFQDALIGPYCSDNGDQGSGVDCSQYPVPSVLSVSWGSQEPLELYSYDVNIYKRICNEWGKLALQGTTVVVASGDNGVDGNGNKNCNNDPRFLADGASSCPYVTSVGATYLPPGTSVDGPEVAVTSYGSGGGFSNIFDAPPWQKNAVSTYLTQHDPKVPEAYFNKAGRAFPDIAAVGDNGFTVSKGAQLIGVGTSMSAPIIAGIFNLINEERLRAGKSTLGLVNPALYKALDEKKALFNDITVGSNPGSLSGQCHTQGFQAAPGWDPVTGLGTPNYPKLRDYFMSLGK